MKKVLITGADGFIGKNLVSAMLDKGIDVYAVVLPSNNIYKDWDAKNLNVFCFDLNEAEKHINDFPENIDVMYHFAWAGVSPEARNDYDIQDKNIKMSLSCMKLAKAIGIKKVVLPGSTNEYLFHGAPLNKNALPSPNDAYGAAKLATRYMCACYADSNGMSYVYTIITGIYSSQRKDNNVIFYTIDKLLKKEKPSLTRLEQLWDYVHIDDVTRALTAVGEHGKDKAVYAIGHGDNWPLYNYINIIHELIDPSLPLGIGEVEYKNGRLPCSCVDLTDIESDTGFRPTIDFDEGIKQVIDKLRSERG